MDALILSVAAGGGHMKAAEAIKEEILTRYPNSRTEIIDTLRYVNPIFDKLVVGSYIGAIKKKPEIYRKLYYMSEYDSNIQDFSSAVNKILSFRLKKLINEFKPSVIACTHPFPLQMIANLKSKKHIDIPAAGIITDYAIHSLWPVDNLEAYIVANEYLKTEMIKRGYNSNIIYPYGIPVSRAFLQKKDKDRLREEFGLENRLTVLIMGGSLGFGEIKDVFKSFI